MDLKEFELPKTKIQPQDRCVFVAEMLIDHKELPSGIVLSTAFDNTDGQKRYKTKQKKRWFVVAVAERCEIMVEVAGKKRKLKRGDEIYIADNIEAISYNLPFLVDWTADTLSDKIKKVHEVEIHGVVPMEEISQ